MGRVKFYYEMYLIGQKKSRLEPFCLYVDGSMFGDQDILIDNGRDGRDSTSIAQIDCTLLVLTKLNIGGIMKKFPKVKRQMRQLAKDRRAHFKKAIADSKLAYIAEYGDVINPDGKNNKTLQKG